MKEVFSMVNKMYEMRDSAKRLHGKNYKRKATPYKRFILACMEKYKLSALEASMKLSDDCKGIEGASSAIILTFSAYLDLSEESIKKKQKSKN